MDGVRIRVGFAQHPKTRALLARLGFTGGFSFVCLLAWASAERPTGDLAGLSDSDIERFAEWPGGDGVLIRELVSAGFLVGLPKSRRIHDFEEHNPIGVMQRKPSPRDNVPVEKVVDLYHTILCPPLPTVNKVTALRRAKIRQRWTDTLTDLEQWRGYFETVKRSPFLMGASQPRPGMRPFRASLDFLIRSEEVPVQVSEGKFHG